MKFEPFALERWMTTYELDVDYDIAESGIYPLTINDLLAFEPPDKARALLERLLQTRLGYSESRGSLELRNLLAATYSDCSADNILVTTGAIEANFLLFTTLLEAGDHVVAPHPAYQQLYSVPRALGCDAETALTASHSLLNLAVQDTLWRALEPSLAVTILQQEGVPFLRLDEAGRRSLTDHLGDVVLVAPEIMVYGAASRRRRPGDDGGGASIDESIDEYELALRFLDPQSGVVVANFVQHRPHGVEIGWFGIRKETSMLAGLSIAAAALWHEVEATMEDQR